MKQQPTPDEFWNMVLTGTHPMLRFGRRLFSLIPSSPRCKLCYSPFHGFGGWLMKLIGRGPWDRNPSVCQYCFDSLSKMGVGGAEIEISLVFADIRGSTALAEKMSPREYSELINAFFCTASDVICRSDGIIDQLVGDEAIGLFIPSFAGPEHAKSAIAASRALIRAMAEVSVDGYSLQIGIGVHTGVTFVGSVGSAGTFTDFTVLGDAVNTTARLASAAGPGEILISESALAHAGMRLLDAERRQLDLKGKAEPMEVAVIRAREAELVS
jgi:adenylate cyclase